MKIGIRREDKNAFEARVPLTPSHVHQLVTDSGLQVLIQPSKIRAFADALYRDAGATVTEDIFDCDLILAVKEIPPKLFRPGKSYLFFSHTIKGQEENMPSLLTMTKKGCQLMDYEKIVDAKGRRLIFFGRHAGLVGMINSLWAYGRRLEWKKHKTPFASILQAVDYSDLDDAKKALGELGKAIEKDGLPKSLCPMVFGFAGYGNVSLGAQEIFDILPFVQITPDQLVEQGQSGQLQGRTPYKVVFKEADMVEPVSQRDCFDLQEYYGQPEKYQSRFERYLPYMNVLVNAIYWDTQYPKLVTVDYLKRAEAQGALALEVIGDITCDVGGSVECNVRSTGSGNPVYVYEPATDKDIDGVAGNGPVVLATDNLPCELGKESSEAFSEILVNLVPKITGADFSGTLESSGLPNEIKRSVILWKGRLTPDYTYLQEHLNEQEK